MRVEAGTVHVARRSIKLGQKTFTALCGLSLPIAFANMSFKEEKAHGLSFDDMRGDLPCHRCVYLDADRRWSKR